MQGIPNPSISWTRTDGKPMARNVEILEGGVIRMNQVIGEERGEYQCTAENIAGKAVMIATLTIHEMPEVTLEPSGSFQVKEGEPLKITCMAKGNPKPRVAWERMGNGDYM